LIYRQFLEPTLVFPYMCFLTPTFDTCGLIYICSILDKKVHAGKNMTAG